MTLDPRTSDLPPAPMPATPPLDWPAPPAPPASPQPTTEGWAGWQVALIAIACLLAGLVAGVLLTDQVDDDSDTDERSAVTTAPTSTTYPFQTVPAVPGNGGVPGEYGSLEVPVPLGFAYPFERWIVSGWTVSTDGESLMRTFDPANRLPRAGFTFVVASTDLTYAGDGIGSPDQLKLYAQDADGAAYLEGCGRVPAPLLAPLEMTRGDTITGQVCFEVPLRSIDGLLLVIEEVLGVPVHFALT